MSVGIAPSVATGAVEGHVAQTSCATMGLTTANLTKYLHRKVTISISGSQCYLNATNMIIDTTLFPVSEKAEASKQENAGRSTPLGGLGAGAVLKLATGGEYWINVTRGAQYVELWIEESPSKGVSLTVAHLIYRSLA